MTTKTKAKKTKKSPAPVATTSYSAPPTVKVLGEVIAWNPGRGGLHRYADVVNALVAASLDPVVARSILPRNAFGRACKKLEREQIIMPCPQHDLGTILAYQFLSKTTSDTVDPWSGDAMKEWVTNTDTIVRVDKTTGKVWSKDTATMLKVQGLVHDAMELRTSADITNIVQRIFDKKADLFPVRDQGGAYFVPKDQLEFVGRVEQFLNALGGRMGRFPVADPDGNGCKSVTEDVSAAFDSMIQAHQDAVDGFDCATHSATFDETVKKINSTRVKIEAYASFLADKKDELLASVEEANKKLLAKVKEITTEKTEWKEPSYTVNFGDIRADERDEEAAE